MIKRIFRILILVMLIACEQGAGKSPKEVRYEDSNGNIFIEKGSDISIIPATYNKTGKSYKIFIYNETSKEIEVVEGLKIETNTFKTFDLKDTDTLTLDIGVHLMFGEKYGLEIEDKKSQISSLGGKFLEVYGVPEDVEWAFVIVPEGKGD